MIRDARVPDVPSIRASRPTSLSSAPGVPRPRCCPGQILGTSCRCLRFRTAGRNAATRYARGRPPALGEAPQAPSARPDLLDLAFPPVARLAVEPNRRPARDRPPMASRSVPPLLALEVTEPVRPAQARRGDPCPHPSHVSRQPHLGKTPDPLGASSARPRGRASGPGDRSSFAAAVER
jgi:hypothetical protein